MSSQEVLSYDLDEGMLDQLAAEFDYRKLVERYRAALGAGGRDPEDVAAEVFGEFGQGWMERSLELGEERPDRTYELIKQAAQETGTYLFPHVAQRFLEIACLGLLPIAEVDIVQNNAKALAHRVEECAVYNAIREQCGEGAARRMGCRHLCLEGLRILYEKLKLKVSVDHKTTMAQDGHCLFVATP